jgi:hypothetical protein
MKRERRQPTRSEWGRITSRRPVVRRERQRDILPKASPNETTSTKLVGGER